MDNFTLVTFITLYVTRTVLWSSKFYILEFIVESCITVIKFLIMFNTKSLAY